MSRSFILNIGLALLWLSLFGGGFIAFVIGMLVGFILLYLFRPVLGSQDYIRRTLAFISFLWVFLREFINSNLSVARVVLFSRREDINPNFITYDVRGLNSWEIYLLSQCITLTPGTVTIDLIEEGSTLVIHSLDANDPDAVRQSIDQSLKAAILGFTR